MSNDSFFTHARYQIATVWQMTAYRFESSNDIRITHPALWWSILALVAGYLLLAVYDYLNYPSDLLYGYVAETISRFKYVVTYTLANFLGLASGYGALFALAIPMRYSSRFWHGLIALNWWGLMISFAIFPLMCVPHVLGEDGALMSLAIIALVFVLLFLLWKSILLIRNTLKVNLFKALALAGISGTVQMGVMAFVVNRAGIAMFEPW